MLFRNGSVHEFYRLESVAHFKTAEYFSGPKKVFSDGEANWSIIVNVHYMQMVIEHAEFFFRGFIFKYSRHVHHVFALLQIIEALEFRVFIHAFSIHTETNRCTLGIKCKYHEEYSTVDEVGREKLLPRKFFFV